MRVRIEPRDVAPEAASRRLGMTLPEFNARLPNLIARGFPQADPDSGNYDLHAVDRWCDARHPHLFGGGGSAIEARDAKDVVHDRLAKMRTARRG